MAIAIGSDKSRDKECHRLGSTRAEGQANTWHTFTRCVVFADGSGRTSVTRYGKVLNFFDFGPENEEVED